MLFTCCSVNISGCSYYDCFVSLYYNAYLPPQIPFHLLKYMAFSHASLHISVHIEHELKFFLQIQEQCTLSYTTSGNKSI